MAMRVEGLEEILQNLNREIEKIKGRSVAGLFAAGLEVESLSRKRTPVDTGDLRASHRTRKMPDNPEAVEVMVEKSYAVFVHEDMDARHKSPGQAKFLESALSNTPILEIIQRYAKIK